MAISGRALRWTWPLWSTSWRPDGLATVGALFRFAGVVRCRQPKTVFTTGNGATLGLAKLTDETSGNEADQGFAEGIVQGVLIGERARSSHRIVFFELAGLSDVHC